MMEVELHSVELVAVPGAAAEEAAFESAVAAQPCWAAAEVQCSPQPKSLQ